MSAAPGLAPLVELVEAAPTLREAAARLRSLLPNLKVLTMDAADLKDESPVASGATRALYLAASDGHCWRLTADPGEAAAIFVAERPLATPADRGEAP
jgi:hypothetical protein